MLWGVLGSAVVFAFITYAVAWILRFRYGCYVVGLTGGIGSGKSTVTAHLRRKGAHVIDFDQLVRDAQEPGGSAFEPLRRAFGQQIVGADGRLDRKALGALVFGAAPEQRANLRKLNALMRVPILKAFAGALLHALFVESQRWVVLDVPLLFERGFQHVCSETLLVYVNPELQIRRVMQRDSCSQSDAEARINAQWSLERKRPMATHVLLNEESVDQLHAQCDVWMSASQHRAHNSAGLTRDLLTPPPRVALFLGAVVAVVPTALVLVRALFFPAGFGAGSGRR